MAGAERDIERYLSEQAKQHGAIVRKVLYQGQRGAPDRWLFFPGGFLLLVECKAPGRKPERIQHEELLRLRSAGYGAIWLDSREQVDLAMATVFRGDLSHASRVALLHESFPL